MANHEEKQIDNREYSISTRIEKELKDFKELHIPIVYINDDDSVRIDQYIFNVWKEKILEWNPALGKTNFYNKKGSNTYTILKEFLSKINDQINGQIEGASCYVLRNVLDKIKSEEITLLQIIANKIRYVEGFDISLIIVSDQDLEYPQQLKNLTRTLYPDFFVASENDIEECINQHYEICGLTPDKEVMEKLKREFKGFHLNEIDHLLDMILMEGGEKTNPEEVQQKKREMVKASGYMEIVETKDADIKGYKGLRDKLNIVKTRMNKDHIKKFAEFKLPNPKGYLLYGPPGCGKSTFAKFIAKETEKPLYKLDVGKLMGRYLGESESNLRKCLSIVDAAAPCVLWIDEIEKALAGMNNPNESHSMRMLSYLLNWMQERTQPVFIVATANQLRLKPELIRKGRFDDAIKIDYPDNDEANAIFLHYLTKGNRANIWKDGSVEETNSEGELADKVKVNSNETSIKFGNENEVKFDGNDDFVKRLCKVLSNISSNNSGPKKEKGTQDTTNNKTTESVKNDDIKIYKISGAFIEAVTNDYLIDTICKNMVDKSDKKDCTKDFDANDFIKFICEEYKKEQDKEKAIESVS